MKKKRKRKVKKMDKGTELLSQMIDLALKYPDLVPDRVIVISASAKTLEKVLTPARLELIRAIKKRKTKSVTQLARLTHRPIESVSRDLKILNFYGFLEFLKEGKQRIPKVTKDVLIVPLGA